MFIYLKKTNRQYYNLEGLWSDAPINKYFNEEPKNIDKKNKLKEILKELSYPEVNFSLMPSKNPDFGDLSTNIALLLTKTLRENPLKIAEKITSKLQNQKPQDINGITVTKPGFINFKIDNFFFQSKINHIIKKAENTAKIQLAKEKQQI